MSSRLRHDARAAALLLVGAMLLTCTGVELAVHVAVAHGGQLPETAAHADHHHHHQHHPDHAPADHAPADEQPTDGCAVCHLLLHFTAGTPAAPAVAAAPDAVSQPLRIASAAPPLAPLPDQAQPRAPPAGA